eukprot:2965283-Pyramimonas_sp.AAC.1
MVYVGWFQVRVREVRENGRSSADLSEELKWVKFSGLEWTKDNKGFFYNRFPPPEQADLGTETDSNVNMQLWYHEVCNVNMQLWYHEVCNGNVL